MEETIKRGSTGFRH